MSFMPRLTGFMALALLATAPAVASAQSGGPSARPSRPVDECGKPATPRPRRDATRPAAAAQPPELLGVRSDSVPAVSGTATPGTESSGHTSGAQTSGTANPQASSTAQGSGFLNSGAVVPQASSTSLQTAQSATSAGPVCVDGPGDARLANGNRDALQLGLGSRGDRPRLGPAASVSVPTAFGVDAGELFFGVAYQDRTRYTSENDAAAVVGIGVGTRRVVAFEAALTTYSTFRGDPLETGGVSFKAHRAMGRQTSLAVGWENAILWGGSDDRGSLYAVGTKLLSLRPDPSSPFATAVVSLGVGNGRFRFEEDDAEDNETVNLFAAAGARVTPYLSLVADWTGQDLNAAASLTPIPRVPAVVTVGLADITGSAGDGARFILALGYGLAFRSPF